MLGRLGSVVALVPLALAVGAPVARAQADPVAVLRQAVDTRNRGDLAGVMAVFAQDAVRQDGTCPTGCVGFAAVRQSMAQSIEEHLQATLLAAQAAGETVTARAELRSDTFRAGGAERVISSFTVELRGGLITRWSSTLDSSDAQTAAYVAYRAALQAGQALPAPALVRLPQTGRRGGVPMLPIAVVALSTGLGAVTVACSSRKGAARAG